LATAGASDLDFGGDRVNLSVPRLARRLQFPLARQFRRSIEEKKT
jgi:hypothetical protein